MLGNAVWAVFTWLRSCSKDLSPDLLKDPELFSETRPAQHKHEAVRTVGLSMLRDELMNKKIKSNWFPRISMFWSNVPVSTSVFEQHIV